MNKTIDLGVSNEGSYYGETVDKSDYKKKHYPVLHISGIELPEVPKEFYAKVKLCKRTETKDYNTDDEDGDTSSCSFDVKEMEIDSEYDEMQDNYKDNKSSDLGAMFLVMAKEEISKGKKG